MRRQTLLSFLALAACLGSLTAQTPSTVITFREGTNFTPRGINNHGQIVGDYTPAAGGPARGFLRSPDGSLQTIQAPNTTGDTRLNGINDLGEIVGATGPANTSRAFLRSATGDFTDLHPLPSVSSNANAINNSGYIVGSHVPIGSYRRAFLRNLAGELITLADIVNNHIAAVAIANTSNRILLNEISQNSGEAYGTQISTDTGAFRPIDFRFQSPISSTNNRGAGITAGHLIAGSLNGNTGFLARVAQPSTGNFTVTTDGVYFQLPNATNTVPSGINDRNQIIGTATIQGQSTGFLLDLCSPALPGTARAHGSGSETAELELQTTGFCVWAADTDVPWISFTQSVGNGPGSVIYTLQPNPTNAERTGRIRIGSSEFVITQSSSECQYTVSPIPPTGIQPEGALRNFSVTTASTCAWTAFSPSSWARILEPSGGTGSGNVSVIFDPITADATASRSVPLRIAGITATFNQAPPPCTLQITRTTLTPPREGAIEGVHVNIRSGCSWTAVPISTAWISSSSFYSINKGPNTLALRIAPNPGPTERTGTLRVSVYPESSSSLTVNVSIRQLAGAACTYSLSPASATVPGTSNETYSFEVVAGSTCPFTYITGTPWIQNVQRSGNLISYTVAASTTRFPRRGFIRINNDLTFIVDQAGNPDTQLAFVPLNRCRIIDTRLGSALTGEYGPPILLGRFSRRVTLTGRCNIPASARAVALQVTAIPLVSLAYLTIYPSNTARPLASTLNSWDGRIVSNLAIVPGPQLEFYPTDYTHLVADVLGYFTAPAPEGIVLYPVTPCRLLDTRATGNSPIPAGTTRTIPVTGHCGIPAHATALSLNITSIPRNTMLESLTVYPAGQNRPAPTPLNAAPGRIVANATILPNGANGSLTIHASQEADVVIDVNAYFAAPSDSGLYFTPRSPCRIADTRSNTGTTEGALTASTTRTFTPASSVPECGIPAEAKAHLLNATLVPTEPTAFLSLFPSPLWTGSSTLNAYDAQVTANAAIVPDAGQGIGALSSNSTHLVLDSSGYFMAVPPEQRRPVPLATGKQEHNQ